MKSKKQKELYTQLKSFVSLIEFHQNEIFSPKQDSALELFKKMIKDESSLGFCNLWYSWSAVLKAFPHDKYQKQVNLIHQLKEELVGFRKTRNYEAREEKTLDSKSTRELLGQMEYRYGDETQDKIRAILKEREHVPTPAQSRLMRKMSIHAGQKLSLQDAQKLRNQLAKKKS